MAQPKRYIGCHIPLPLFEAIERVRGELGIPDRAAVIREALADWVEQNKPDDEVMRLIVELTGAVRRVRAVQAALDEAIVAWRTSKSEELEDLIDKLSQEVGIDNPIKESKKGK